MEMQYFKDYSPALGREMECKVLRPRRPADALHPLPGWPVF